MISDVDPVLYPADERKLKSKLPAVVGSTIKAFIGSGILFLPAAFFKAGIAFATVALIIVSLFAIFCIVQLVSIRDHYQSGRELTYADIGSLAFGKTGHFLVNFSITLSQCGFCAVYASFIPHTLMTLIDLTNCHVSGTWFSTFLFCQLILLVPLSFVRKLESLAVTTIIADILLFIALSTILGWSIYGMSHEWKNPSLPPIKESAVGALGTFIFSLEGIAMILPIYSIFQSSYASLPMARPSFKQKSSGGMSFPTLMTITILGLTCLYIICGAIPYLYVFGVRGESITDSITFYLPTVWWSYAIQAGYCVALFFSFPFMISPALTIVENAVLYYFFPRPQGDIYSENNGLMAASAGDLDLLTLSLQDEDLAGIVVDDNSVGDMGGFPITSRKHLIVGNISRAILTVIVVLVSYFGSSQLDNLVSLVGAFACTPLAFIYPPLFHWKLMQGNSVTSNIFNWFVILLGTAVLIFTTQQTFASWQTVDFDPCDHSKH